MSQPKITETHILTAVAIFSQKEIETILGNIVADAAGFPKGTEGMTLTMRFEDETAGSPPYRTGQKARVEIELDLTMQAKAADQQAAQRRALAELHEEERRLELGDDLPAAQIDARAELDTRGRK